MTDLNLIHPDRLIEFAPRFVEKLADLPEHGMGWQAVRVRLRDGRDVRHLIATNSQYIYVFDGEPFASDDIVEVDLEDVGR